jgi:hypothetical protein
MAAYFRRITGKGFIVDQPSNLSGVRTYKGKDYVVLENARGVLAVYRVRRLAQPRVGSTAQQLARSPAAGSLHARDLLRTPH